MCNFMGVRVSKIEFIRLRQIEKDLGTLAAMRVLETMKSGFTYSDSIIIRKVGEDIEAVAAHWEFIPHWIKSMEEVVSARKKGIPWLNARSETLLESKMFGVAARKRRCLVLASHFFEWRHYQSEGAKKSTAYPYSIGLKDKEYFYMAGIWQPWTDKLSGETMDTFAIVTTEANSLMEQVHNTKKRMPTILTEDLSYEWIMDDLNDEKIKEIASYQIPSNQMNAHPIRKDFKIAEDPCEEEKYHELPVLELAV